MPIDLIYFLKVNIALAILFSAYWILIRNNKNFQLNRFYLLSIFFLSFLLPKITFPADYNFSAEIEQISNTNISEIYSDFQNKDFNENLKEKTKVDHKNIFTVYLLISLILLTKILVDLFNLYKKIRFGKKYYQNSYIIVINNSVKSPFSFFKYIFTNNSDINPAIIAHEQVHIKQLHTIDLIFAQLISILFWINPVVYLIKRELVAQHEYMADAIVMQNPHYQSLYLQQILLQVQNKFTHSIASPFNNLLIRKRLKMMKKESDNFQKHTRYLVLAATTVFIIFMYGCLNEEPIVTEISKTQPKKININRQQNIPKGYPLDKNKISGTTGFGMRMHPIQKVKRFHTGMDFRTEKGTEVYATADGVIVKADYGGGYGNRIIIKHSDKYSTLYAHLQSFYVTVNKHVKAGDVIGYVGATGMATVPILHYEVRINGEFVDPANYLN